MGNFISYLYCCGDGFAQTDEERRFCYTNFTHIMDSIWAGSESNTKPIYKLYEYLRLNKHSRQIKYSKHIARLHGQIQIQNQNQNQNQTQHNQAIKPNPILILI